MTELHPSNRQKLLNGQYYLSQDVLGQGAFGRVYKAIDTQNGRTVAIKEIKLLGDRISQEDLNEINLLRQIDHPNIVKYIDHFVLHNFLYIVTEYLEGGSLQANFRTFGLISEEYYSFIITQVLLGLAELHENAILHRDLKAANLLQDNQSTIKITDFGVSSKLSDQQHPNAIAGSPFWIAREVLLMEQCNEKSDIWSVGATLYELLCGYPPYYNYNPMAAMYNIATCQEIEKIPNDYPDAYNFIQQCFIFNVDERPSAQQLLKHQFITKYSKNIAYIMNNQKQCLFENLRLGFVNLYFDTTDIFHMQKSPHNNVDDDDFFDQIQGNLVLKNSTQKMHADAARQQLRDFQEGNFQLGRYVAEMCNAEDRVFAKVFIEEMNKKYSFELFIQCFEQFNLFLQQQTHLDQVQRSDIEQELSKFIGCIKLLMYLVKKETNDEEGLQKELNYMQQLLQYNILNVFQPLNELQKLSEQHQFIKRDYNISRYVIQLISFFSNNFMIYPLFSSKFGFKKILEAKELVAMSDYSVLETVTNLLRNFQQNQFLYNGKIYKNSFKQEYLGSLAQQTTVTITLFKIIHKLLRYDVDSKTFSDVYSNFKLNSQLEKQEEHNARCELIRVLFQTVYNVYCLPIQFNDEAVQMQICTELMTILTAFVEILQQGQRCGACNGQNQHFLINYCNMMIDIFQKIVLYLQKRNSSDAVGNHFKALIQVSECGHFAQKVSVLLHQVVAQRNQLVFDHLQDRSFFALMFSPDNPEAVARRVIEILGGVTFDQLGTKYVGCLLGNRVLDLVFERFDGCTALQLYNRLYMVRNFVSCSDSQLRQLLRPGRHRPFQLYRLRAQKLQCARQVVAYITARPYLAHVCAVVRQEPDSEALLSEFLELVRASAEVRTFVLHSSMIDFLDQQVFTPQPGAAPRFRNLWMQVLAELYRTSRHCRIFVRQLDLARKLSLFMLDTEASQEVIEIYQDVLQMAVF